MTNYKKGYWITEETRDFLSQDYLLENETVESRVRNIADEVQVITGIEGIADKIEEYTLNGWISYSSPIWSNFGRERALPISCNGSWIDDTVSDILFKTAEIGMMTKLGAGTSAYLGAIRPRGSIISTGGKSEGPMHFAELIESSVNIISQGSVRRGSAAIYLDIDHPDIMEFLEAREEGNRIQHLSLAVVVRDAWMISMLDGDKDKRKVWARVIKKRFETGYPYIMFYDNVNNNRPQVYKDKNRFIAASQLCIEIALSSSVDESFVCDLASANVLHYEEWKGTDLVQTIAIILDAAMSEYIRKIKALPETDRYLMKNALNFAERQRAIGVGVLGWHSYLQRHSIPFESFKAKIKNKEIFKHMDEETLKASKWMAEEFGEPEMLKGYGERWVTRMALAPTTSSSFILGQVSPSIEPENSNYYTKDLAKGKFGIRNGFLKEILETLGKNTEEVWKDILLHGGSVQHIEWLDDHNKEVFKTFGEINQGEIVAQASQRQKFIDQMQSLNVMVHPDTPPKEVSELLIAGWKAGVKSFYYQRSTNKAQELSRSLINCAACEA